MKILITGATGYVGFNLIGPLLEKGYSISAVLRSPDDRLPKNVNQILIDGLLEDNLSALRPDAVIHLASYLTSRSEKEDIQKLIDANISFGSRLLNGLKKSSLKYFINVGSFSEYHHNDGNLDPTYYYAATKTAFRSILKYYSGLCGFKVIQVVPFSIYGGKDRQKKIIDLLFDAINADEPVKLSEGLQYLDFIHLNDVVEFFETLLQYVEKIDDGETFFLGTGKPYNLREVAGLIEKITNCQPNILWGAIPPRERDTIYAAASIVTMKKHLQWQPKISLEQGLILKKNEIFNNG